MDILKNLDPAQKEAVMATDGAVLILAGAGSGKTRVLTYKVAHLISKGVSPDNILCVTFTNKAASEMKERVLNLIASGKKNVTPPYVGTFHAFCSKLLRIDGKHIGLGQGYLIYDDDDSLSLIKRIMNDLDISTKHFKPSSILYSISSAKSELMSAADYLPFAHGHFAQTVFRVYEIYEKALLEIGACDFDDLLFKTVKLFEKEPRILEKWAGRYEYVLVDEYQDVNTSQYTLTKLLASVHGNLTVVGDASQAIYSFRGADFRNILNFKHDFPDAKVFNLEQNYRSTKNILTAANTVISLNSSHPVLKLWTENETGEKITIYTALNEVDEANYVINEVLTSGKSLSSFAILYRTNAQSRTIEEALLHANIPYRLVGGVSFYARKEVKDVLSYLRLLVNSKDRVSKNRVEKIGKRRLEKFLEFSEKLEAKPMTPVDVMDGVLKATDYLLFIDDGTEQGLMRVENVKELKSVAADFENLTDFLESVALMEGRVTPTKSYDDNNKDLVTLMTIHAAKGLEFENVFIVGMEEGLFPHARSMLDTSQMEEERRLAYVGMTRAMKKLYLTYAERRLYFGSLSSNLVSRFVVDIPEELITPI